MPDSHPLVSSWFIDLVQRIEPSPAMLAKAQTHLSEIRARLEYDFAVSKCVVIGSHYKGTAIRGSSDVDLLVAVSKDEALKWASGNSSTTIVNRMAKSLRDRFPRTTVRRDAQAVVVGFAQGEHSIDVVPAVFAGFAGSPYYDIPDGSGGWIRTSPEGQRKFVQDSNKASGGRVVPTLRLLKWWARSRPATAPVKSIYLESFLGLTGIAVGSSYQSALDDSFYSLVELAARNAKDPLGAAPSGIACARTALQRGSILDALKSASERSGRAREAERRGNAEEAKRLWRIVFNHASN